MPRTYTPRRASARFLDGDCPPGVLAIFDNGGTTKRNGSVDRYTIFYTHVEVDPHGGAWIGYLGTSGDPGSFGGHGEMPDHQMRAFRDRFYHLSTTWSSLPEAVKRAVRRDCAELALAAQV